MGTRPTERPHVALGPRRDEARAHQAMRQQLGDPLGAFDVGLAPRQGLDVRRVEQPDLEGTFEQVEDRLPELARALEADMRAAARSARPSSASCLDGAWGSVAGRSAGIAGAPLGSRTTRLPLILLLNYNCRTNAPFVKGSTRTGDGACGAAVVGAPRSRAGRGH